jgi:hypothetical protein
MKVFDIFFISFDEENADENWHRLKTSYPHAKRVHRIEGIHHAHRKASELSEAEYFFTVDADNEIINNPFLNLPDNLNANAVYVWRAINGVNGLVYGYGGIKLWPKALFENSKPLENFTDHATEITRDYKVVKKIGSKTVFNTSAYSSWKSGFRESYKLTKLYMTQGDHEAFERLKIWLSVGSHVDDGLWCILGAHEGMREYLSLKDSNTDLINRFIDLSQTFYSRQYGKPIDHIKQLQLSEGLNDFRVELLGPDESLRAATELTKSFKSS